MLNEKCIFVLLIKEDKEGQVKNRQFLRFSIEERSEWTRIKSGGLNSGVKKRLKN